MDFTDPRHGQDRLNVVGPDAPTCQDREPAGCGPRQALERGEIVHDRASPRRREHPIHPELDERVEAFVEISGQIEGAMKGDRERPGDIDETRDALPGHAALRVEGTEYDPAGPCVARHADVAEHDVDLQVRVEKVASTRTDHHHDRDRQALHRGLDGPRARRRSALDEIGAQLHAVRSRRCRGDGEVGRGAAHLEHGRSVGPRHGPTACGVAAMDAR